MGYIDLVKLLGSVGGIRGLFNVEVYGLVASRLSRPANIHQNVQLEAGGMFVKVDVFAVNLKTYRKYLQAHGYWDDVYMVNGSLVSYVKSDGNVFPDWYTLNGTLRFGSKTTQDYVSLLDFEKSGNVWKLNTLKPRDIEISTWVDKGDCYDWVRQSQAAGKVMHPGYVLDLHPFVCMERKVSLAESLSKVQNGVEITDPAIIDGSVGKSFVRESRSEVLSRSEAESEMSSLLSNAKTRSLEMFKQEFSGFTLDDITMVYIRQLAESIRENMKSRKTPDTQTGRALLLAYLSRFGALSEGKFCGVSVGQYLVDEFDEVMGYMFEDGVLSFAKAPYNLCKAAFSNPERFYAGILMEVTGVDLGKAVASCESMGLSFSKLVNVNPYGLCLVSGLSFKDAEYLALCMGLNHDSLVRSVAAYDSYICTGSDGATAYPVGSFGCVGVSLTETRYAKVRSCGHYLSNRVVMDMSCFFGVSMVGYDVMKFRHIGSSYVMPVGDLKSYISSGLGVEYKGYVTSARLLEKELYIYQRMWELGSTKTYYTKDVIDYYIGEYERIEGITLEEKQRDSVRLLQHCAGVTAGGAGSGKTTTSKCLLYVLGKLEPGAEVICSAPTGKAARRMQEVTHHGVKTMHSTFRIGVDESDDGEMSEDGVYLFDENAMVTLDLMYSCLKKISGRSKVYLFGDFDQLPPIGKGLPFKNLLRFMPCVFLEVSKRAADGSDITRNADILVRHSEPGDFVGLTDGRDFKLLQCADKDIPSMAVRVVRNYLNQVKMEGLPDADGILPDDIQVVTPYAKPGCAWGAVSMNKLLQPLFNPIRGYDKAFVVGENLFLEGDRVIHTERNMYRMQWYQRESDGVYRKVYGFGICNGEVGKICGVVSGIEIKSESGVQPSGFKYPEEMRDDTGWKGYFVDVEYPDYVYGNGGIHILYRCKEDKTGVSSEGRTLVGEDLTRLMLFYAGTVHKMQGSQAKVVISLIGNVAFRGFVTRNMIYTGFTRAERVAIGIGSVGNDLGSMLSRARRDVPEVFTVGEMLV